MNAIAVIHIIKIVIKLFSDLVCTCASVICYLSVYPPVRPVKTSCCPQHSVNVCISLCNCASAGTVKGKKDSELGY